MGFPDYDDLLDRLRGLTSNPNNAEFTRSNLIALLDVLTTHLDEALASKVGELEDGTHVVGQHPVAHLLSGLVLALQDLDKGLRVPVFEAAVGMQNARRRWHVRQEDKALIEGLEVFQRVKKIKTRKAAAMQAASALKKGKYTRKGKALSWQDLYGLYSRHKYNDL
ncbi:MAG: hypothetical protein RIS94_453 [Pseudomonadota bacterium]|jgi:hypothetical protein